MAPTSMMARCPAKINLALRVVGLRDDGYHELDTIFQAVDLWDTIEIEDASSLSLTCDEHSLPVDSSNLVIAAAELLMKEKGCRGRGAALRLRKTIPVQSGLGGGSSDAAGALLLCSRWWNLTLSSEEMVELGSRLGADVPFFLLGGTARGRGRGDIVKRLPFIGETPILIGLPPFGISTSEVFSELRVRLTHPENGVSFPILSAHKWQEENDFHIAANDLEAVVFEFWPELEEFRDALWRAGASSALLSGSGSAVYGIFRDHDRMRQAEVDLGPAFERWTLLRTRTVNGAAHVVDPDQRPR